MSGIDGLHSGQIITSRTDRKKASFFIKGGELCGQ